MVEDITRVKEFALLLNPTLDTMGNLESYIIITIRKILNYCNLKSLPGELVEIVGEMVIDLIEVNNINSTDEDDSGEVKSISEGDTTVTFDFSSNEHYRKELNKYFKNYTSHIAPFRKIRW